MENVAQHHYNIPLMACDLSQISAIGHDPETNTLAIQFKSRPGTTGSIYYYRNFTADDFAAFSGAESLGAHFGKHIKLNAEKHPYVKVKGVEAIDPAIDAAKPCAVGGENALPAHPGDKMLVLVEKEVGDTDPVLVRTYQPK